MRELRPLTALRGLGALYVALLHFCATAEQHSAVAIPSLAPRGHLGVDLFFVLSGFIMAYTYQADFQQRGLKAFPDFLGKRVARILPLHAAVLLVMVALALASQAVLGASILRDIPDGTAVTDLLLNLLLLHGIGLGRNLNGPSWSISTEFVAYLLYPLLLAVFVHSRRWAVAAGLLVAIGGLAYLAAGQPRLGLSYDGPGWSLIRCLAEFSLGLYAYRVYRSPASAWTGRTSVVIAISAAIGALLVLRLGDLVTVAFFPLLIVALARNEGFPARLLSSGPIYFMGLISYSFYLVHNMMRDIWLAGLRWLHPEPVGMLEAYLFAVAGLLSVVPVAWLAYVAIEKRGRNVVRALLAPGRRAASRARQEASAA